jgi:hypothetical protein|tara:strand:- start:132 stop:317 length:186 start_codon:yes stop_codon:yes gene_type:complete
MTNFESALQYIDSATTRNKLSTIEHGLARVYDAGFFTEKEYALLDEKIVDKFILLNHWSIG